MVKQKLTSHPIGNLEDFQRERHIFDLLFNRGMGRLSVITPNIFRVQYTIQKNWTFKPLLSIEEKEWKSVPIQIKRDKEKLDITTPRLIISLVFRPFNIRVYDHEGHLLTQDNPRNSVVFKGPRIIVNKKCPPKVPIIGLGDLPGPIDRSGALHKLEMRESSQSELVSHQNPQLVFPLFCYQSKDVAVGHFLDNATCSLIDFRKSPLGEFAMTTDDGELDYYWILGNDTDEVVQGFFTLIGNSAFPPRWSLEIIKGLESKLDHKSFLKSYDPVRRDFVLTSSVTVHQPNGQATGLWDEKPTRLLKSFRRSDRIPHFMVEMDQKLPLEKLKKKELTSLGKSNRLVQVNGDGELLMNNGYTYLDPFYESSHEYISEKLQPLFTAGLRGIEVKDAYPPWDRKNLKDTVFRCVQEIVAEDGENIERLVHEVEGRKLVGYMPNGLAKGLYKAQLQSRPELRPLVVSSSGFAGVQRYSVLRPLHGKMDWKDISRYLTRLLGLNVSGAPLLCADISVEEDFEESFMCRLVYALAFVPLIRLRFHSNFKLDELVNAEKFMEALEKVFNLREAWLPYLYQLMWKAHSRGAPIMYPTAYFYPGWAPSRGVQDQFLIGPYVLVSPWMSKDPSGEVELPPGQWAEVESAKVHEGGQKVMVDKDNPLPMFYREGSIVPQFDIKTPELSKSIVINIFPKAESVTESEVYDDDGESTKYRKDEQSAIGIRLSSTNKGHVMKISRRQGKVNPSWTSYLLRFFQSRLDIQRVVYNRLELEYLPTLEDLLSQRHGFYLDDEKEILYIKIPYEREGGVVRF